jgi:hypothetical protein
MGFYHRFGLHNHDEDLFHGFLPSFRSSSSFILQMEALFRVFHLSFNLHLHDEDFAPEKNYRFFFRFVLFVTGTFS